MLYTIGTQQTRSTDPDPSRRSKKTKLNAGGEVFVPRSREARTLVSILILI